MLRTAAQVAAETGVNSRSIRRAALALGVGTRTPAGWIYDDADLASIRAYLERPDKLGRRYRS